MIEIAEAIDGLAVCVGLGLVAIALAMFIHK